MSSKYIKRIVAAVLSTVILAGTLSGCGWSTSGGSDSVGYDTEGTELNVFNWSEYIPQSVIDEFQKKYGIKVNYTTYASNEEMLAKIMAGDSQFDLAVASDYMVDIMRKQELIEELDMKNIPNFKNIGAQFKNLSFDPGNKYTVPYMWGDAVIVVNTKKIQGDVTSVSDLWDSRFKNSMVVLDDERSVIGLALKKLGYSLNETNPSRLDAAEKELVKLKPNIKIYDSDSPKTSLINGEAAAGYVWGAEAALAEKDNKDLKTFFPKEGMYLWQDNFVVPNEAPHKKNAELFINFILDPEISAQISKVYPYANPNVEAQKLMDKETLANTTIYPSEADVKKGEHLKDVGDTIKKYDEIWTELKQ